MQSVKIGKLLRQLAVLISRNFQLIWNQKLTLGSLILQAPLMVLVIKLVGEPDCFTSNLINIGSRTVLFIVCAMASFMGLLNSYREICKDREIIFREASMKANWPIPWLKSSRPLPMRWRSKPRWMRIFTASAWMC